MKKRITLMFAILTMNPLLQLAGIKTGLFLSTAGLMLSFTSEVNATSKKLNPSSYEYHIEIGLEKSRKNDYEGAIEDFTKAIELNPDKDDAYIERGIAKYQLEDYEGAIEDFTKAIELYQDNQNAIFWRGFTKYELEDYEGAVEDFTQVIELNPDDGDAYFERGIAKYELEDYEGAVEDFTQVIELNPYDELLSSALYFRGDTKYQLEDYEGAIEDFTQVIGTYAEDPELYYLIGASKLNLENYKGCSDINKAIELGKADGYDWEWLDSVEANFCSN